MENHSEYDDLLARYVLNELSEDEQKELDRWINEKEANKLYFEQFKATWNLAGAGSLTDRIDINEEWNYYNRVVKGGELLKSVQKEQENIPFEEAAPRRSPIRLMRMAAVAAVLVMACVTILYLQQGEPRGGQVTATVIKKDTLHREPVIRTERNNSDAPRTVQLADGSSVVLYMNSELRFSDVFEEDQRSVRLKGKADFKVAKDPSRPFTVYHGEISTTALGTEFTVTAYDNTSTDVVKLYEGKVVVKSTDEAIKKLKKAYYLEPGQELLYNKATATAFVRSFREAVASQPGKKEEITLPEDFEGSWIMFNNQPLKEVFDQLSAVYEVDIDYRNADIDKMYFIGRFDEKDSIATILKRISILHQLKLTRVNHKYVVSR
jgi:ferric-dicitrate binding protein FerR (iron transport regulator)